MDHPEQQYGTSAKFCDYVFEHQLEHLQPRQIVDFGAGGGKNGRIARQVLNASATLVAVEGYDKAADMLARGSLYDQVCHTMIQEWVSNATAEYDLAVFGDVLEHLTPAEIHKVIRQCLKRFRYIIVVCPLHDIFQEAEYGNSLEIHRTYITQQFFDRYDPIEKHIAKSEEWTIMNVLIVSQRESAPIYRRMSWWVFHRAMLILQPLGLARPFVNLLKRFALKYKWLLRANRTR
jgi:hypothetical protein